MKASSGQGKVGGRCTVKCYVEKHCHSGGYEQPYKDPWKAGPCMGSAKEIYGSGKGNHDLLANKSVKFNQSMQCCFLQNTHLVSKSYRILIDLWQQLTLDQ